MIYNWVDLAGLCAVLVLVHTLYKQRVMLFLVMLGAIFISNDMLVAAREFLQNGEAERGYMEDFCGDADKVRRYPDQVERCHRALQFVNAPLARHLHLHVAGRLHSIYDAIFLRWATDTYMQILVLVVIIWVTFQLVQMAVERHKINRNAEVSLRQTEIQAETLAALSMQNRRLSRMLTDGQANGHTDLSGSDGPTVTDPDE